MNDTSTISWMIMGGPRYDEHAQDPRQLEHRRALLESNGRGGRGSFRAGLAAFLENLATHSGPSLTTDRCITTC
jgi:hypothetical protein